MIFKKQMTMFSDSGYFGHFEHPKNLVWYSFVEMAPLVAGIGVDLVCTCCYFTAHY